MIAKNNLVYKEDKEQRNKVFRMMMWDYNIAPEDVDAVFCGIKNKAGHYDESALFKKMLESFSWYTILETVPFDKIKTLLTPELISKLRFKSLQNKYTYVFERLQSNL